MKHRFPAEIDARLSELTFTRQAQVLERVRARRTVRPLPRRAAALLLALALMLCGTAVALTLRYSHRFDVERQARGALSSAYGLTPEMLDLFSASVEQGEGGWTARFVPIGWPEQMGEYTVTGGPAGVTAAWSHDGEAPSEAIWGPEALQRFMDARKARLGAVAQAGGWTGTLEELAAMDAPLLSLSGVDWQLHVLPGADDIQPDAAEALARQAVTEKFGVDAAALEGFRVNASFLLYTGDGRKEYRFLLEGGYGLGTFDVVVTSPAGEIARCDWWITAESVYLPEGDLSRYPEAAREFVEAGGFGLLSPEDKAAVYRRYEAAGLIDLLPQGEFVSPAPADLTEQAAVAQAKEALMATYDLPEAGFSLFGIRTAMLRQGEGRVWQVRFVGLLHDRYMWLSDQTLGDYTVTLTSDGAVTGCEWSLSSRFPGTHTHDTFGQAEVFTGADLGYAVALIDQLDEILEKYPSYPYYVDDTELSLEDRAAFDGLMRHAGFNPRTYPNLLPRESDVSQQEALDLARQALESECGLTRETLDAWRLEVSFWMRYDLRDEPVRVWEFAFKGAEIYWVDVGAEDGMIELIEHDDLSLGEG